MCEFGENVWRRRRRMAWPIVLAHWWHRRQTFSPNVRFSHFFYPAPSCWLAVGSQAMQKRCFKIFVCSFILGYHFPFSNFSWLELPHYLLCSPKVTWKSFKIFWYILSSQTGDKIRMGCWQVIYFVTLLLRSVFTRNVCANKLSLIFY